MENKTGSQSPLIHWLDMTAKFAGISVSLSFLCSVVYDYGYFKALGLTFSDVPSSISDHLRSTLLWFPIMLFGVGGATIFELITRRIERGMTEEEIIQSSSDPEKTRKFRESPTKFMPYVGGLIIISYFLWGDFIIGGIPFALTILWFYIGMWLNNHPIILQRRSFHLKMAIIFIPALLIYLGSWGYAEGKQLLLKNQFQTIKLKHDAHGQISAVIVRFYDKGVLFKNAKNDEITYIKWDDISKIDKNIGDKTFYGWLSKWIPKTPTIEQKKHSP